MLRSTVGARAVQETLGYTGAGIGVAVIDSGITSWHDDLTYQGRSTLVKVKNGQRVSAFVDFVNGRLNPYDDYGHGTHVAGIIAGNGYDTFGSRAGIAPDANLVGLKVLDGNGRGVISNVIAAIEWSITNRAAYNIRVINLSVGSSITESYNTDPLALAAKRAVDAGIVVVAAAGNLGKNAKGKPQYGGITAPGNAPWVLTVGASSTEGTVSRLDDVYAPYSSRGPSAIDYQAKPDLLAPGTGVVSLSDATSLLYFTNPGLLLKGLLGNKPYISLSGTSMAAPVVAGTVALMLQANPSLTPNLVKAAIQYTAQVYPGYNALTQGAGFLNTKGAVDLVRFFKTAQAGQRLTVPSTWSRTLLWGNHRLQGGVIKPNASAWKVGVVWGAPKSLTGQNIVWGTRLSASEDNIVWGTAASEDNIVWGTASASEDNIVWGTYASEDNIVWGTRVERRQHRVGHEGVERRQHRVGHRLLRQELPERCLGHARQRRQHRLGHGRFEDNIVWGTSGSTDNVTWATSGDDTTLFDNPSTDPVSYDTVPFDDLFGTVTTVPAVNSLTGAIGGLL